MYNTNALHTVDNRWIGMYERREAQPRKFDTNYLYD